MLKKNGSAPRVRGMLEPPAPEPPNTRFSPACAGNAVPHLATWRNPSVQPRVCGECDAGGAPLFQPVGSAPRVRGMPKAWPLCHPSSRFSPACAGNAAAGVAGGVHHPVQPRVCGECVSRQNRFAIPPGSAPRVRGMPLLPSLCTCWGRFSPACAGNAYCGTSTCSISTVQPRVCGECAAGGISRMSRGGSAPRVRGMRWGMVLSIPARRFSPACAGNARRVWRTAMHCSVQPRVCGECWVLGQPMRITVGSAPRVRGMPPLIC